MVAPVYTNKQQTNKTKQKRYLDNLVQRLVNDDCTSVRFFILTLLDLDLLNDLLCEINGHY